ncbi:hypothetical protein TCON_2079 [Astathelohania contejeani]|uniref:Uncharacterized protein n=1 Tax=Astathelohania contejeani TaxID=164912 RepID=A0ABQ7HX11_9MICR|nr:hypothetical protein TCON_2079 [Thelohania contejeani]
MEPYHQKRVKQKWEDVLKYIETSENLLISRPSEVKYFEQLLNSWLLYLPRLKNVVIKKGHWSTSPNRWYQIDEGKTLIIFQSPFEIIVGGPNGKKVSAVFLIKDIILLLVEAIQKEKRSITIHWDNNYSNYQSNGIKTEDVTEY